MSSEIRPSGRVYLYPGRGRGAQHPFTQGTWKDLEAENIILAPGLQVRFYCDDGNERGERDYLLFAGTVDRDPVTGTWYAIVDWDSFEHESDLAPPE